MAESLTPPAPFLGAESWELEVWPRKLRHPIDAICDQTPAHPRNFVCRIRGCYLQVGTNATRCLCLQRRRPSSDDRSSSPPSMASMNRSFIDGIDFAYCDVEKIPTCSAGDQKRGARGLSKHANSHAPWPLFLAIVHMPPMPVKPPAPPILEDSGLVVDSVRRGTTSVIHGVEAWLEVIPVLHSMQSVPDLPCPLDRRGWCSCVLSMRGSV